MFANVRSNVWTVYCVECGLWTVWRTLYCVEDGGVKT